jgi:hypothetical protein
VGCVKVKSELAEVANNVIEITPDASVLTPGK